MKLSFFLLSLIVLQGIAPGQAQSIHTFNEGLYVENVHRYGREVRFTDPLAHALAVGTFASPEEGQPYILEEDEVWKALSANEEGKFTGRIRSGYLSLSYHSPKSQKALLKISGNSMVYVNGVPRAGDIYGDGWLYLPVSLKKGENEILARFNGLWSGISAELQLDPKPVTLQVADATLPDKVLGSGQDQMTGAVVVINATDRRLQNARMETKLNGRIQMVDLPEIPPMTFRKVPFEMDASAMTEKGEYNCSLQLLVGKRVSDTQEITLSARDETEEHYQQTFISQIDGSVQYYGVAPQKGGPDENPALFLSVHGAGVEAIGQARAYSLKDWGVLVAPTNRRPRGFNWEDWGRIDALEVLEIAKEKYRPDPERIYLTGHSMGGHGTWYLGATYPGKWAAIAPCAGYPTLMGYGSADGRIPENASTDAEKTLLRASNPSDVIQLAHNYQASGVYIHHGDADRVVPVTYARQMRGILAAFHPDFSYYEYPGGSHWFGSESVDWAPLFDYFRWHQIPADSAVNTIDFTTANPAISASYKWAHILQQTVPLEYSRVKLERKPDQMAISGTTENVSILGLDVSNYPLDSIITLELDEAQLEWKKNSDTLLYLHRSQETWEFGQAPEPYDKGIYRNGTFKEPFNHRMILVYGTSGSREEKEWAYNKARLDAETWYYRGNGAVDIIADREFDLEVHGDRGVILYGNADTNRAWDLLLAHSPIQVNREEIRVGDTVYSGEDLGAYFMVPRKDHPQRSVAIISGTGNAGRQTLFANQYFAGGSGFPDYVIIRADLPVVGLESILASGYYQNDWSLTKAK
ncbi:carboxylesterase family protein [Cyclobacterium roseum]|uniref:carboxylesterase family protein n=1 Tax=Cyclobacterium roseum TaxID=2666137 RepID=UPI00139080CF|nr:prolyl oligopeptidase family serine peptidase [Cyclobacterium roseum]